jgi:hypothetical protein
MVVVSVVLALPLFYHGKFVLGHLPLQRHARDDGGGAALKVVQCHPFLANSGVNQVRFADWADDKSCFKCLEKNNKPTDKGDSSLTILLCDLPPIKSTSDFPRSPS